MHGMVVNEGRVAEVWFMCHDGSHIFAISVGTAKCGVQEMKP